MSFGWLLATAVVAGVASRLKSSPERIVIEYDPFPNCQTAREQAIFDKMRSDYNQGEFTESLEAAETLLKIFPRCPFLHIQRGMCIGQFGRYKEAIREFETTLALDGASEAGRTYGMGPNTQVVQADIQLLRNMIVARDRALASAAVPSSQGTKAEAPKPRAKKTKSESASLSGKGTTRSSRAKDEGTRARNEGGSETTSRRGRSSARKRLNEGEPSTGESVDARDAGA